MDISGFILEKTHEFLNSTGILHTEILQSQHKSYLHNCLRFLLFSDAIE